MDLFLSIISLPLTIPLAAMKKFIKVGLLSKEKILEDAMEKLDSDEHRVTLRFPGFQEGDVEFLENQKNLAQIFANAPDLAIKLASYVGLPGGVQPIVGSLTGLLQSRVCKSTEYIEQAFAELEIEQKIVHSAHSFVKAELSSIERQLQLFGDPELPNEQKKTCLAIADNACYELLEKFCDQDFYLRKYLFVYAPFLVNFVAMYLPIAQANLRLTTTVQRREDSRRNMKRLRDLVIYFRDESIKERLKYIFKLRNNDYFSGVPIMTLINLELDHSGLLSYLSDVTYVMDTLRNPDKKYEPVYVVNIYDGYQLEACEFIYEWYREQARKLYGSYFCKALEGIEQFI